MWKPTPDLKLVKTRTICPDNTVRYLQVIEQKWIREGFKDGETYVIETKWQPLPEELRDV